MLKRKKRSNVVHLPICFGFEHQWLLKCLWSVCKKKVDLASRFLGWSKRKTEFVSLREQAITISANVMPFKNDLIALPVDKIKINILMSICINV